ncbi:MAG: O-antigen ligase family protein [Terracidiphilus sp.]
MAFAACVAFAFMFFGGDVKASPQFAWIPFDLTGGVSALALVLSAMSFLARNSKVSTQVLWMLALYIAISSAIMWTELTPYAVEKMSRLFTFSFMAALLPAFILTRLQDVRLFVTSIIVFGTLISVAALVQLVTGETIHGRITGISADTVSLGRNAGIALVGLYTVASCSGRSKMWLAVLCMPLLLVLVASGSRGPTLFALGVIVLVTIRWTHKSIRGILIAFALFVSTALVVSHEPPILPRLSTDRIVAFMEQRFDSSAEERVSAGQAAIHQICISPFGLGIAGFAQVYNFGSVTNRVYPHNIVLEVAVEEGWLVGLLFIVIVAMAVSRGYRAAVIEPQLRPFFAILIFTFCNALVSGDMNDNRIVYAMLCIALLSPKIITASRSAPADAYAQV